ncbi:MAG: DUF1449 domain-containing protein [Cyanobacteria bacterium J06642_11]
MLFAIANLPYWIFLATGALLFFIVILSGGGDDGDADIDIDIDSPEFGFEDFLGDEAGEGVADGDPGPLAMLQWLGLGRVPIILLLALDLSLWGLFGWLANVLFYGLLAPILSGLVGSVIFLGSMVLALVLGGKISAPIGTIFASFGENSSADRLIGCVGTVSSAQVHAVSTGKIAQADVLDPAKNLVTVNAVLPEWCRVQPKIGDKVLVIERPEKQNFYFVIAQKSVDEDRWFSSRTR